MLDYTNNDTWATGLIAHDMLSPPGLEPFGAQGDVKLFTDGEYQDIPACYPPVLGDVVRGLLAVDPKDRLSADQAILMLKGLIGAGDAGGEEKEGYEGKEGKDDQGDSQDLKDVLAFGFDEAKARELFAANGGDKDETVHALMQFAPAAVAAVGVAPVERSWTRAGKDVARQADEMTRQHVETLSGMGFTQEQAVNALKRSSSLEAAIAWLMSQ